MFNFNLNVICISVFYGVRISEQIRCFKEEL